MKLNEELKLKTAGIYSNPGDAGALLPICVGDFSSAEVNGSDPEAGGMLPTVLIDVLTWTYCANVGRSFSVDQVYVEEVLQAESVYTINLVNDFQSKGIITTITFNTDPGGRVISWRGKGLVDGTGVLISNPITAIEHVFTTYGNWMSSDFDPSTVHEARRRCDAHGYTIHWVFDENLVYKDWLTQLGSHYFMDILLTSKSQLALVLDEVISVDPGRIMAQLDARIDVDAAAPEDAVEWDLDRRNLCNEVTIRYRYSWARRDFTGTTDPPLTDVRSISLYGGGEGGRQAREIRLPGIRTQAHLDNWSALFFSRYGLLPAMVRFPVKTLRYLALMPSNYVTLSWRWGPEPTGVGWTDRILKVLNTTFDFENHRTLLECLDTGLDFKPATYAILQDASANTWYLSVDDAGQYLLAQTNPGMLAVNNTTWSWIRLISPTSVTYYVQPQAGGTWVISTTQPSGSGTTTPVILTSRAGQLWVLGIADAPPTVLFDVSPRRLPFGGQDWLLGVWDRGRWDVNVWA